MASRFSKCRFKRKHISLLAHSDDRDSDESISNKLTDFQDISWTSDFEENDMTWEMFSQDEEEGSNDESIIELPVEEKCISSFKTGLQTWAVDFQVPHNAITALLKLHQQFQVHNIQEANLPLSAASLLKTKKSYIHNYCEGGEMINFSLKEYVLKRINAGLDFTSEKMKTISTTKRYQTLESESLNSLLTLNLYIDGMPIVKSGNLQFWPILAVVNESVDHSPFPITIYQGTEKPVNIEQFLTPLCEQLSDVFKNGITVKSIIYSVCVYALICDAPARAYIKCCKTHGGYFACEFCCCAGEYIGKVIYPDFNASQRTDVQFENFVYKEEGVVNGRMHGHQLKISPLTKFIPMVTAVPTDYMHLVCLGVMKLLLKIWTSSSLTENNRLSATQRANLSLAIVNLGKDLPAEFHRRMRHLNLLDRWKATEFRTFLLYIGPIALKNILPKALYNHFLLFHFAIAVLISSEFSDKFLPCIKKILKHFAQEFGQLYGQQYLVYNVHTVSHLADYVENLGCLDAWSAFPSENYLGKLGKLLRKPTQQINQIANRIQEIETFGSVCRKPHNVAKSISVGNVVSTSVGIIFVTHVEKSGSVTGFLLKLVDDIYSYPFPSSKINIGIYQKMEKQRVFNLSEKIKCCHWEYGTGTNQFYVIPMMNSLYFG